MNTIETSKKIKKFLSYREGNTKKSYANSLKKFLKWYDGKYPNSDFDSYLKDIRLMEVKEKIATTDRYEDDIKDFLKQSKKNYPPKTITGDLAVFKSLLRHYRIDLANAFWDDVKRLKGGNAAINQNIICSLKELKQILTHANTRQRAIFMTMITSGLRVGEACSLIMDNIDLKHSYPRITIVDAKNDVTGHTRASPEAKFAIMEWLKIRDKELRKSCKRQMTFHTIPKDTNIEKFVEKEDRLFPYRERTIEKEWNELLEKAGYDEKNKRYDGKEKGARYKRNLHTLRKVFRTQFGKYSEDLAEYFMNHVSELKRTYDFKGDEWLDQEYGKGLKYLTIFEIHVDESDRIKQITKKLEKKDEQIKELQNKMDKMEYYLDQKAHLLKLLEVQLEQEKIKKELRTR